MSRKIVAKLRRYHLTVTGSIFLVALLFYAAGWASGAIMFSLLGVVVEVIAWISLLGAEPEKSSASHKED